MAMYVSTNRVDITRRAMDACANGAPKTMTTQVSAPRLMSIDAGMAIVSTSSIVRLVCSKMAARDWVAARVSRASA